MKQLFLLPFLFLLTMGIVMGYGEFGSGTFGDGNFGFGTPEPAVTPSPTPSSSGGGGGGGKAIDGFSKGTTTKTINYGDAFIFRSKGYRHTLVLLKVNPDSIKLRITSNPAELTLKAGETKETDTDGNNLNDFSIKLNSISKYGGSFTFTILDETKPIVKEEPKAEIPIKEVEEIEIPQEDIPIKEIPELIEPAVEVEKRNLSALFVLVIITFIGILITIIIIYSEKKRKQEKENGKQKT